MTLRTEVVRSTPASSLALGIGSATAAAAAVAGLGLGKCTFEVALGSTVDLAGGGGVFLAVGSVVGVTPVVSAVEEADNKRKDNGSGYGGQDKHDNLRMGWSVRRSSETMCQVVGLQFAILTHLDLVRVALSIITGL